MAKGSSRRGKRPGAGRGLSGAVGGPSTGHGVNYQVQYAVYKALGLIAESLRAPHHTWAIRIEPRVGSGGEPTQWDLGIDPPGTLIEAKLNPTRRDLIEWLDRVADGGKSTPCGRFALVYSKGGGMLLASLDKLVRTAGEADGDPERFRALIGMERIEDLDPVLRSLGERAYDILRRIDLVPQPERVLHENIEMRAGLLASGTGRDRLVQFLFSKFAAAIPHRATFRGLDLIAELGRQKIVLCTPPVVDPDDLSETTVAALVVLQACPSGLPLEVIARALSTPAADLGEQLAPLVKEGVIMAGDGLWYLRPLTGRIEGSAVPDLLARTLDALLGFVGEHGRDPAGRAQVGNAVALARLCLASRPGPVEPVY